MYSFLPYIGSGGDYMMRKSTPARRIGAVKVILFGVLAAAVILLAGALGRRSGGSVIRAGTNEERVAYLQSLGWEVEQTPILEQEITLPKEFPDVLNQYNELQRQQGFDLEEYAGKKLTLYTYRITNHPDAEEADASLYVYRSALVGGDVHSTSFTGFMTALR